MKNTGARLIHVVAVFCQHLLMVEGISHCLTYTSIFEEHGIAVPAKIEINPLDIVDLRVVVIKVFAIGLCLPLFGCQLKFFNITTFQR